MFRTHRKEYDERHLIAMVDAVISYKGYKEKEIEKQVEIAKKTIEESVKIERIIEIEMEIFTKK